MGEFEFSENIPDSVVYVSHLNYFLLVCEKQIRFENNERSSRSIDCGFDFGSCLLGRGETASRLQQVGCGFCCGCGFPFGSGGDWIKRCLHCYKEMIEERVQVFRNLAANRYYNHFNLVLEELIERVLYNRRWGRQYTRDVAGFFL
jgi:hypothetical protein